MKIKHLLQRAGMLAVIAVLLILTGNSRAQQTHPAGKTPSTAPSVEVEVVKTPLVMQSGDPNLRQWKWVASFLAFAPHLMGRDLGDCLVEMVNATPRQALPSDEARTFLAFEGTRAIFIYPLVAPGLRPAFGGPHDMTALDKQLEEVKALPEQFRMFVRQRDALARQLDDGNALAGLARHTPRPGLGGPTQEMRYCVALAIRIVAPTAEKAEAYAKALITAYNQGAVEPIRKATEAQMAAVRARLSELPATLEEARKAVESVEEQLARYTAVPEESEAALRSKRLTSEIEHAGLQARVEEIDRLLKDSLPQSTREHLEDRKASTLLELAELHARARATGGVLELFAAESIQRRRLEDRDHQVLSAYEKAITAMEQVQGTIGKLQGFLDSPVCQPMQVLDSKITIHPIEWKESPVAPSAPQGAPRRGAPARRGYFEEPPPQGPGE